jgi:DNA-binding MarR family transcriptional regulator
MMENAGESVLIESILTASDKLFRILLPTVPRELLELDITMPQMKIILMLFIHSPLRMSTIAAELEVTLPTATSFIDRLVEKHYVIRDSQPDDRRVVLCRLSETGLKTVGGIWETGRQELKKILGEMDNSKLEMFVNALQSMMVVAHDQRKVNPENNGLSNHSH